MDRVGRGVGASTRRNGVNTSMGSEDTMADSVRKVFNPMYKGNSPLTTSLAILAGTRKPDSVVRHLLFVLASVGRVRRMGTSSDVRRWDIPCNVEGRSG